MGTLRSAHLRRLVLFVTISALGVWASSCSDGGTTSPTPVIPPVVNTPPVISAIAAQGARANEPANFADLGETVVLAATVTDAETSPDRLTFAWSAPLGTFTGTGATVQWTAPTGIAVPTNVVITLTVTEPLSSVAETSGPAVSQSVSATATVRVHDSANEGAALGRLFLLEFSDSRLTDANDILRNFWDGCSGKADEHADIDDNRANWTINSYVIGQTASTTIAFGGAWNVNGWHEHGDGYMTIPCQWDDMLKDGSGAGRSSGMCSLWSVYRESRWWLCSSHYLGTRTTASGVTTIEVR